MKTQLLEDIGESATLSLEPSGRVSNIKSRQGTPDIAQARAATPVRPRPASGVWKQRPAGEPVVIATQQPEQAPPPPPPPPPPPQELPPHFEAIVAVEAQHVPPQQVDEVAIFPAEPKLAAYATPSEFAPQGPVFDFTRPSPTAPAPALFTREPRWFERSGRRYLLWGACVLAGALVIQAGLWTYDARNNAKAPALVTNELKAEPQIDKAVKPRAIVAREFTLGPDGEVRVTPAAPVPPLVLLGPDPATATKVEPALALAAGRAELQAPPKPEPVAQHAPAVPLAKRVRRTSDEQPDAAARPARAKVVRAPDRQIARAPVIQAERKPEQDLAMAATLKACREHGYHPAQCVKRACSVTKYGFVCRGK